MTNFLAAWCYIYICSFLPIRTGVSHSQCSSSTWWTLVLLYGCWNARFLLQLNINHFKFPLWAISRLDEKDVQFIGQHCHILALKVNKVNAAERLLHSSSHFQEIHLLGYNVW